MFEFNKWFDVSSLHAKIKKMAPVDKKLQKKREAGKLNKTALCWTKK